MQPLTGTRILDLTLALAGPAATQRLADWGADVVKVEPPGSGEWSRSHPIVNAHLDGETTVFLAFNRSKRSIAIDLRDPEGQALFDRLCAAADVLVHNFRPGVVERLGIDPERVRARHPHLVYAFVSGYGLSGPAARRPGQDLLLQAYSGSMFSVGAATDRPQPGPIFAADVISSHFLAEGILAALLARARTGAGQVVDVSMLAAMLDSQMQELVTYLNVGVGPQRSGQPLAHAMINPPYGVYRTADDWVAIAMADPTALAEALDSEFIRGLGTWARMAEHRDEVFQEVERLVPSRTTAEWLARFDEFGVWAGPVRGYADLAADPQIAANGYLTEVPTNAGGSFVAPDGAVRFSSGPAAVHRPPPALDGDRDDVLADWLAEPATARHSSPA